MTVLDKSDRHGGRFRTGGRRGVCPTGRCLGRVVVEWGGGGAEALGGLGEARHERVAASGGRGRAAKAVAGGAEGVELGVAGRAGVLLGSQDAVARGVEGVDLVAERGLDGVRSGPLAPELLARAGQLCLGGGAGRGVALDVLARLAGRGGDLAQELADPPVARGARLGLGPQARELVLGGGDEVAQAVALGERRRELGLEDVEAPAHVALRRLGAAGPALGEHGRVDDDVVAGLLRRGRDGGLHAGDGTPGAGRRAAGTSAAEASPAGTSGSLGPMLYRLLGMLVWKVGRLVLRRKYGTVMVPRGVLIGAAAAVVLALLLGGRKATGGGSGQLTP